MSNKELVIKLVDLEFSLVNYIEEHKKLKFKSHRDVNRIITANKLCCTYGFAVQYLYRVAVKFIPKYVRNTELLLDEITKLKDEVENKELKDLRFGLQPKYKFSEEETELNTLMLRHQLRYLSRWDDR
jgi:hypothetical protein